MPVDIGARLAVEVDGLVSPVLTSGPSCMHCLHKLDSPKTCYSMRFNHHKCLQEKAGTVTAVNRRGVVAEVDFDDGVRSPHSFPSPPA